MRNRGGDSFVRKTRFVPVCLQMASSNVEYYQKQKELQDFMCEQYVIITGQLLTWTLLHFFMSESYLLLFFFVFSYAYKIYNYDNLHYLAFIWFWSKITDIIMTIMHDLYDILPIDGVKITLMFKRYTCSCKHIWFIKYLNFLVLTCHWSPPD